MRPHKASRRVVTDLSLTGKGAEQRSVPVEITVAPGLTSATHWTIEVLPPAKEVRRATAAGEEPKLRAAMQLPAQVRSRDAKGFANEQQLDGDQFECMYEGGGVAPVHAVRVSRCREALCSALPRLAPLPQLNPFVCLPTHPPALFLCLAPDRHQVC